jgi:hypothetical protein
MIDREKPSDAPDTLDFWLQIDDLIRDCERFERECADAVNSPETLELIRRVAAELDDYDRRRAAFERSPDGIAELERLAAFAEIAPLAA